MTEMLIFAALVALTAALVYPLQRAMLDGLRTYRDALLRHVESTTGFAVSYESMNPSIFGTLDLRKIKVFKHSAREKNAPPVLSIERLRVKYSLWELLATRSIHSILAVHIDRPLITVDSAEALTELFTKRADDTAGKEKRAAPPSGTAVEDGGGGRGAAFLASFASIYTRCLRTFNSASTAAKRGCFLARMPPRLNRFPLMPLPAAARWN